MPGPSRRGKLLTSLTSATGVKHREVERRIRQNILEGIWQAGDRIPAEHLLSEQFGVAYMTTRQAVSSLVQGGLLQRIPGKGTFVLPPAAEELTTRRRTSLFLLVPAYWQRLDPYYFPDLLGGFQDYMTQEGRTVTILDYATADREDLLAPAGETPGAPGAAVACLLLGREEAHLADRLRDRGCRVLAVNRYTGRRAIASIAPDNAGGTGLAVDHLVQLGHRRIALIKGNPGNLDAAERRRGFRAAMRRHGLRLDHEAGDGFREECGYQAANKLLSAPEPPTALVCASDLAAIGAMKAAGERGLSVPRDLSVVGFGDFTVAAYVHPGLTTIHLPLAQLGRHIASSLILLAGDGALSSEIIPTHLVCRGTTAVAPPLLSSLPVTCPRPLAE